MGPLATGLWESWWSWCQLSSVWGQILGQLEEGLKVCQGRCWSARGRGWLTFGVGADLLVGGLYPDMQAGRLWWYWCPLVYGTGHTASWGWCLPPDGWICVQSFWLQGPGAPGPGVSTLVCRTMFWGF